MVTLISGVLLLPALLQKQNKETQVVRLTLISMVLLALLLPAAVLQAQTQGQNNNTAKTTTLNFPLRKVGVLYPRPGAPAHYAAAFDQALAAVAEDIRAAGGQFPLEIVKDTLGQDTQETQALLTSLQQQKVAAVLVPALQLESFNATPGKLDIRPLLSSNYPTATVTLIDADPAQTIQSVAESMQNLLHQLRFGGQVKKLVLLYDKADPFSTACFDLSQTLLAQEKFDVAVRTFTAGGSDYSSLVNGIKLAYPSATLFVCARDTDLKPLIAQAYQKTRLNNRILGLSIGSSAVALDLSKGVGDGNLSKLAHVVAAPEAVAGKLAEKFSNNRLAAQLYLGIWIMAVNASKANADGNTGIASLVSDAGPNPLIESQSGKFALLGLFLPEVFSLTPTALTTTTAVSITATAAPTLTVQPTPTRARVMTPPTATLALSMSTPISAAVSISPTEAAVVPTPSAPRFKTYGATLVCAIHVGSVDDHGYNQAHHEGLQQMAEQVTGVRLVEEENIPETEAVASVIDQMVQDGCSIIFGQSFGYLPYLVQAADRYPDVIFLYPGGAESRPNLGTYWANNFEAMYLAGIAAGSATKTGRLGFIAAFPIPNVLAAVNAFQLGAHSVNANATTQLVITGDWVNPTKERAATLVLAKAGADVVTMIVDSPATVVETAEKQGIYVVGFHSSSLQELAPKGWLTGVAYTWGNYYTEVVNEVRNHQWQAANIRIGIESDLVGLAPFGPAVSANTQAQIETARTALLRGKLRVFQGPLLDNQGKERIAAGRSGDLRLVDTIDWVVQGVSQLDLPSANSALPEAKATPSPATATPTPGKQK